MYTLRVKGRFYEGYSSCGIVTLSYVKFSDTLTCGLRRYDTLCASTQQPALAAVLCMDSKLTTVLLHDKSTNFVGLSYDEFPSDLNYFDIAEDATDLRIFNYFASFLLSLYARFTTDSRYDGFTVH